MDEAAILHDLHDPTIRNGRGMRYEDVAAKHGTSRGMVWSIAVEHKARKHEERCQERAIERRQRRKETTALLRNKDQTADVIDAMDGLDDESVNCIITSVPYNLGRRYGGCADIDRQTFTHFHGWLITVVAEMTRVLAQGGVLFLQLGTTKDEQEGRYPLDILLFPTLLQLGLTFQNRVMWKIPHGLTPKRRMAERYETALVFSKGEPAHFNANAARIPQKEPEKRAFKGPNIGQLSGNPLGAHPTDVWEITNVGHNHPERTGHPAQFPEAIARKAMMLYTMPGDLVLDPFIGSGTTAAVAIQTGRAWTGFDLFYADVRAKRLAAATPDNSSPLPGVTPESCAVWQAEAHPVSFPAQQKLAVEA
jgi:DNA modification methylase